MQNITRNCWHYNLVEIPHKYSAFLNRSENDSVTSEGPRSKSASSYTLTEQHSIFVPESIFFPPNLTPKAFVARLSVRSALIRIPMNTTTGPRYPFTQARSSGAAR